MEVLDWRTQAPLLALGAESALLAAAGYLGDGPWILICLVLAAALGLWAWLSALVHRRAIADTPTSRIHAAAQGYVELVGEGRPLPDGALLSPMSGLPCLWYRYTLYRRVNDRWEFESRGASEQVFLLHDGSGHCLVDPVGAQVLSSHQETRETRDQRYTEALLLAGDRLYVLGQFHTTSPTHQGLDHRQDLDDLLSDWKNDPDDLRRRFDRDGNGQVDAVEWSAAVAAARQEVEARHQDRRRESARHHLGKPAGGRPFLISDHPPAELEKRYALWTWAHGCLLLLVLALAAWRVHDLT